MALSNYVFSTTMSRFILVTLKQYYLMKVLTELVTVFLLGKAQLSISDEYICKRVSGSGGFV